MALTLKRASQVFRATLWLMMVHLCTKFGCDRLSGLKDIFRENHGQRGTVYTIMKKIYLLIYLLLAWLPTLGRKTLSLTHTHTLAQSVTHTHTHTHTHTFAQCHTYTHTHTHTHTHTRQKEEEGVGEEGEG